jgi:hypothetical protein
MKIKVVRKIQANLEQKEMNVIMHALEEYANSRDVAARPGEREIAAALYAGFQDAESECA